MSVDFISLKDKTYNDENKEFPRTVSLHLKDGKVFLLGTLCHGTEISIDRQNARELIKLLEPIAAIGLGVKLTAKGKAEFMVAHGVTFETSFQAPASIVIFPGEIDIKRDGIGGAFPFKGDSAIEFMAIAKEYWEENENMTIDSAFLATAYDLLKVEEITNA